MPGPEAAVLRLDAGVAPPGAVRTPGRLLAWVVRQHLARVRRARGAQAQQLLTQYLPVVRAVAARAFSRCKGAVPLDELFSTAYEEACKGALRFDFRLGYAPAPYLRRWAEFGVRALLRERLAETDVHPDQDEDGSRWEHLGGVDASLGEGLGVAALEALLAAFAAGREVRQRRILRCLLRELDDDTICRRVGCDLALIAEVRAELATCLRNHGVDVHPDVEISPSEVARRWGVPRKIVNAALARGRLQARRRGGTWVVREAEARAWVRRRTAS